LNGKAGSAFGSTSSRHGGNETTLMSIYNMLAHLGLIIVPLGYADPIMRKAGTPMAPRMSRSATPSSQTRTNSKSPASKAGGSRWSQGRLRKPRRQFRRRRNVSRRWGGSEDATRRRSTSGVLRRSTREI
jgi:multimeric flavodoxin WrbA